MEISHAIMRVGSSLVDSLHDPLKDSEYEIVTGFCSNGHCIGSKEILSSYGRSLGSRSLGSVSLVSVQPRLSGFGTPSCMQCISGRG